MLTNETIIKAAIDMYCLQNGNSVKVSDLAKACGTSATRINRVLREGGELIADEVEVAYWDKNQYCTRYRLAPAVMPSRRYMVKLLKQLTAERDHLLGRPSV